MPVGGKVSWLRRGTGFFKPPGVVFGIRFDRTVPVIEADLEKFVSDFFAKPQRAVRVLFYKTFGRPVVLMYFIRRYGFANNRYVQVIYDPESGNLILGREHFVVYSAKEAVEKTVTYLRSF